MNESLDVHVYGPTKEQIDQHMREDPTYIPWVSMSFDPKQPRHVYDMATLYDSEEDQVGRLMLLVSDDLGQLVEVPALNCVVHHGAIGNCLVATCARSTAAYSAVQADSEAPA